MLFFFSSRFRRDPWGFIALSSASTSCLGPDFCLFPAKVTKRLFRLGGYLSSS